VYLLPTDNMAPGPRRPLRAPARPSGLPRSEQDGRYAAHRIIIREGVQLAFIYETTVNPEADQNSHAFTLDIVGYNKHVLEVGCATGYFTKVLYERGCTVVGIELDADAAAVAEKWAERVVVGDLDAGELWQELDGEQFDAITFGDVLEHLRDPLATLRAAVRNLKPSGIVVISVPNIAHGDVRMALLDGRFSYSETGLLDRTHIRFFTKAGLYDMVRQAGLILVETRRVQMPLFHTELGVSRGDVPQATVNGILEDPEAETYQFVVKALPDNGTQTMSTLAQKVTDLTDEAHGEVVRTALHLKRLHDAEREIEDLQSARRDLGRAHQALAELQAQKDAVEQENRAILSTRTFRMLSPFRRVYGRLRHGSTPPPANRAP